MGGNANARRKNNDSKDRCITGASILHDKVKKSKVSPTRSSKINIKSSNNTIQQPLLRYTGDIRDNELWGDSPENKSEQSFRVIFQNVNGLETYNDFADVHALCNLFLHQEADAIGLAETNLNWDVNMNFRKTNKIIRRYWKQVCMTTSLCSDPINKSYIPGGTCSIVTGPAISRVASKGQDPWNMGRFSFIKLATSGSYGRFMYLIAAYRICSNSGGPDTVFAQQYIRMRERGVTHPDPKQALLDDL